MVNPDFSWSKSPILVGFSLLCSAKIFTPLAMPQVVRASHLVKNPQHSMEDHPRIVSG
jgi:hypothetical protein